MIKKNHQLISAAILLLLSDVVNAEITEQYSPAISTDRALATPNSVQLGYSLDRYSHTFDNNPIATLQYGRATSWGSMSLRINASNRYQSHDNQYEVDLYPRLWDGGYAYLNLGTSDGNLFPRNRLGAEIFSSLGHSFEGSLGVRHLAFSNSVTIYTGSLSKYVGNYLFTIRPYVTHSGAGTSVSTSMSVTRYFADADEYLRIRASTGKSADEQKFGSLPPQAVTLRSHSVGLSGQWSPRKAIFISPSFSHERQELLFNPGQYVGVDKFSIAISHRF